MSAAFDTIELKMPFKAEYVSIARLTASGVANRLGFDIETIEDIKVAIAEVCNKLVRAGSKSEDNYNVIFNMYSNKLEIFFACQDKSLKCIFNDGEDELGISIISALMDSVEFCSEGIYLLTMTKALEGDE